MNDKIKRILNKYFIIYENNYSNGLFYELESWTDKGVNMFITLDSNKNIIEEFKDYIDFFDIDEEIEIHRQNRDYKFNFTIKKQDEYNGNKINYITKIKLR